MRSICFAIFRFRICFPSLFWDSPHFMTPHNRCSPTLNRVSIFSVDSVLQTWSYYGTAFAYGNSCCFSVNTLLTTFIMVIVEHSYGEVFARCTILPCKRVGIIYFSHMHSLVWPIVCVGPKHRVCIGREVYTDAITFVYRMMVRSYEGGFRSQNSRHPCKPILIVV